MEKTYNPKAIENKWYQFWEDNGYFAPNGDDTAAPYCIMIPPPNVTGSLHMGHAFQDAIMDALIRFHRMQGNNTLWQVGTDHAGIATQMVVERQLLQEGLSRHDLGREAFIEKIWDWKAHSGGKITQQLRRLGASVDWSRERFTMDEGLSKAVQTVFIQLYRENLIYRGQRLVNWDPVLHSAVSDLEVISEEEQGSLWHLRYPIANSTEHLVIATTRPETMLGDSAVAVHPEDERYQHLIGQQVALPLCDRRIPIIADEYVDPEFGTGCVKITPAHDFNDYEVGMRHDLPLINILTIDAKINDEAPEAYRGLDRFDARQKVIDDLSALDLLEKIEDHTLKVPRGDRTGAVIEPFLTDQWFVKVDALARPAIEAVESGKIKFVPENWSKTYFEWMRNIQDWCISRQLWWGHRIPAWYDEQNQAYVGYNEADVRQFYGLADDVVLNQDEDVLDTWFSSALWPFSTLGWPEQTPEFKSFYPTNVLVTGFDIIFFWVARMIMFGLKFAGDVPFDTVYIHGLIQDHEGQKMSKSKGNVLDPLDLIDGIDLESLVAKRTTGLMQPKMAAKIEKATRKAFPEGIPAFGTDALRFTFLALATTGRHIRFDLARVEGYRNFCNKIWNAARYVLMNTEGKASDLAVGAKDPSIADQWILSRWQQTKAKMVEYYGKYRFDLAAQCIYEFVWNEYCDWYLELSKPILMGENISDANLRATRHTLITVLDEILRMLHPMMPYITEEIWQRVAPLTNSNAKSLIIHRLPDVDQSLIHADIEATMEWLQTFIVGIRNIRGEMNISPKKQLPVYLQHAQDLDQQRAGMYAPFLQTLANIELKGLLDKEQAIGPVATALVGELQILIPLEGLVDIDQEVQRLEKKLQKTQKEADKKAKMVNNPHYQKNAPQEVVEKEKQELSALEQSLVQIKDSIHRLSGQSSQASQSNS